MPAKTNKPDSDIDLEWVMEDSDTLPDIVLNKPAGTSTPSHISEALSSTDTPITSLLQLPIETNNLQLQETTEPQSNLDQDDRNEEYGPLLGVTTDDKAYQWTIEPQPCEPSSQLLEIENAATSMASNLLHTVTNSEPSNSTCIPRPDMEING